MYAWVNKIGSELLHTPLKMRFQVPDPIVGEGEGMFHGGPSGGLKSISRFAFFGTEFFTGDAYAWVNRNGRLLSHTPL